jgi:hypothetical protein
MSTLSPAPTTVHSNGQIVVTGLAPQSVGTQQNIQGGLINHAAMKTAQSIKDQSAHAVKAGVTMRGSGRLRRGGAIMHAPVVPEGGTIPGVSFAGNHQAILNHLNQMKANASYDKLAGTQPYKVSGGKRRRKTNGRSKHRNLRRKFLKRSNHTRRRHHVRRR